TPEPLQVATRKVQLADVRLDRHGRITAAPCWAYRPDPYGYPKPSRAAWQDLLRALQARADATYERRLAAGARLWGLPPRRVEVRPPDAHRRRTCRACAGVFYAQEMHIRVCSPACQRALRAGRPRPSRARPKQEARCQGCGESFQQSRTDARFCG